MSRCVRVDVFAVAVNYWSRSTPTYLKKNWRNEPLLPEVANTHGDQIALFGDKEEAEAEAVFFVAVHPKYLGTVKVEQLIKGGYVTLGIRE